MSLSDDKRVEMLRELHYMARKRYETRYSYGWKMVVAICTGFGVAAGFVVSSSEWRPSLVVAIVAAVGSLIIVCLVHWWTRLQRQYDQNDGQTMYYWESAIEAALGVERPTELHRREWKRYGEDGKPATPIIYNHPHLWASTLIPALFAMLFVLSMFVKWESKTEGGSSVSAHSDGTQNIDVKIVKP